MPVDAGGRTVLTSIFKHAVSHPLRAGRLGIEGDQQADLTVHGGVDKAVYAYPSEHYSWWREQLPDIEMPWGMFGENLTTEGVLESDLPIGQLLRVGTVLFQVRQPRMPCFKLALKFGRPDMVKRFWASGRSGFYLAVCEEGVLQAGDAMERDVVPDPLFTVAEVVRLYRDPAPAREALERAIAAPLAGSWKRELRERLSLAASE